MNAEALELYLAETAALSIIGIIDASGYMSGVIENRHKVRSKDIKDFMGLCEQAPANSCKRLLMATYLMCYSSSAYPEINELIGAENMKTVSVTPHYGITKLPLQEACISEPMNLWPGSGVENKKKSGETFDPHSTEKAVIEEVVIRIPQIADPVFIKKQLSDGQKVGNALMNSKQTISGIFTKSPKSDLVRTLTPVSSALKHNLLPLHNSYSSISGTESIVERVDAEKELSNYSPQLISDLLNNKVEQKHRLVRARSLVGQMTTAGELHYDELIKDLEQRKRFIKNIDFEGVSNRIIQAKKNWMQNRFILKSKLFKAMVSVDSATQYPNSANFYLGIKY